MTTTVTHVPYLMSIVAGCWQWHCLHCHEISALFASRPEAFGDAADHQHQHAEETPHA